jgi:hypothetical protein
MSTAMISDIRDFPDVIYLKKRGNDWQSDTIHSSVLVETEDASSINLVLSIQANPPVTFGDGTRRKIVGSKEINGQGLFEFSWDIEEKGQIQKPQYVIIEVITEDDEVPPNTSDEGLYTEIKKEESPDKVNHGKEKKIAGGRK